jgi:hypothetical protein
MVQHESDMVQYGDALLDYRAYYPPLATAELIKTRCCKVLFTTLSIDYARNTLAIPPDWPSQEGTACCHPPVFGGWPGRLLEPL